jgi:hypothetical protein
MFKQLFKKFLREFQLMAGRSPQTPKEWMDIQDEVVRYINKTKGVPKKDVPPFQGWNPKIVGKEKITKEDVLKGPVTVDGPKGPRTWDLSKKKGEVIDFPKKKASGGRIGMMIGGFTKAKVLIQMLKNTLKGSKDPYVKKTFPNFIKEIQANPSLANNENVWRNFTTGLPKNQRLIVHSDDSVDFFRQTEFGPHNIERTLEFQKKHNLSREQANTILKMEPEDRVLEMKRLETIRNKTMQAEGGRVPLMYGGDPGFAFEYGGSWADWHDQHRNTMPVEQYIQTKLPKARLPFREMQSGGLAYMLGEPTYMKYGAGGSVGHAPWHKPTGQPQPQGQNETPTPNVATRPDPMKAPRGLPSLAPKNMDPAYMQQQMMQKAMMGRGQGMMGQGPRTMANAGGRIGFGEGTPEIPKFEDLGIKEEKLHKMLEEYRRWKEDYEDKIMRAPKQDAAHGGRIGYAAGGFNAARRAFLKWLGGITGAGVVAGTGLLKLGSKAAPKVIKEAEVITRGADGMPSYITDLIQVVKAKGTRDIIEGFKRSDYSTVHRYKGVEVIDEAGGATRIKKGQEKSMYGSDEPSYHEVEMEIKPQYREQIDPDSGVSWYKDADGKKVYETKIPDEYAEYTAKPDMDGKLKDVEEFIDDVDHLELKKIADEKKTLFEDAVFKPDTLPGIFEKTKKTKKASGGLAHMLGE